MVGRWISLVAAVTLVGCPYPDVPECIDEDGDGYGDVANYFGGCDFPEAGDCDDTNAAVYPGADPDCDDVLDNDCDGVTDYNEEDSDGDGYTECQIDCDDEDAEVFPFATEVCNAKDDDCDDSTDEGFDADWDGYYQCGADGETGTEDDDCDDNDADSYPGAPEYCDDADNDCDGDVDEEDELEYLDYWPDTDSDGYGDVNADPVNDCAPVDGHVDNVTDCDDEDPTVYPGAEELCDGIDNDCDGAVPADETDDDGDGHDECNDGDCDDTDPTVNVSAEELCDGLDTDCDGAAGTEEVDDDGDGYMVCEGDCDDANAAANPGETEVCDGFDTDCSGAAGADEVDVDGDGFMVCENDCDDTEATAYPGAPELCDGVDNDCDGSLGDEDDLDGDGVEPCAGDCDDTDPAIYPHSGEVPLDGTDQDCDGLDYCVDLDCDGWADILFVNQSQADSYIFWGSDTGYSDSDRSEVSTTSNSYSASIGDLDGDGYLDILFSEYCPGNQCGYSTPVWYGGAGGTFTADVANALPTLGSRANALGDLDGDGNVDIVFANHYDLAGADHEPDSYVYWGSPSGYSTDVREELPTVSTTGVDLADLDGDGHMEIAFANYIDGADYTTDSYVYWGSASGYGSADPVLASEGTEGVTFADLNGDGFAEILFANSWDGGSPNIDSFIYWGGPSWDYATFTEIPGHGAYEIAADDLDGDGTLDVVVANFQDGGNYDIESTIYWGPDWNDTNTTPMETTGASDVEIADLNGDGDLDIVFATSRNDGGAEYSFIYWGPDFVTSTPLQTVSAYGLAIAGPGVDLPRTVPCDDVDDDDGDGYTECDGDCDDGDASIFSGALEICGDGIDQDCDRQDGYCNVDDDNDGFTDADGDCDDADPAAYPGALDLPADGIDQNCDGADSAELLVISREDAGTSYLYGVDPDSGDETIITEGQQPRWSPDGTEIVYSIPTGAEDSDGNIYVVDVADSSVQQLTTSGEDSSPFWSSDGTRIFFHSDRDTSYGALWRMDADGASQVRLLSTYNGYGGGSAHPFDTRLVVSCHNGDWMVCETDEDGSYETLMTGATTRGPCYSVDGASIYYADAASGLFVMADDGSSQTQLPNTQSSDANPELSVGGTRLCFSNTESGERKIVIMGIDGSGRARLTSSPAGEPEEICDWHPWGN